MSLRFLNSWRVSVVHVPYYVTTLPTAIQKRHWHPRETLILNIHPVDYAFRLRTYGVAVPTDSCEIHPGLLHKEANSATNDFLITACINNGKKKNALCLAKISLKKYCIFAAMAEFQAIKLIWPSALAC